MFERYTEKARRVIFFARFEASSFGSPYIETEHLLLGLLREDKALTNRFLRSHASVESIRKQIEDHTTIREKTPLRSTYHIERVQASAGLCGRRGGSACASTYRDGACAAGAAARRGCFAAEILRERGLQLPAVREELQRMPEENEPRREQDVLVAESLHKVCARLPSIGSLLIFWMFRAVGWGR